ncbi:CGNR zinc finger domain-containing protein [Pseudonocardia sp. GCM10023141]|uniref:CGNR zinc finger domain-containing protein n=1 Tax=Pseudonocardia sp. GCM10023141 TaxID=3252653 RepID=UPI00360FB20D
MPALGERLEADGALRFDAGPPWLDLLATVGSAYGPAPVERLRGLPELTTWLEREGLTPARAPVADDVRNAWALREALRPIVLAVLAAEPVTAAQAAALQPWLDHDLPTRVVVRDGRPAPDRPPTVAAALGRVCRQAVEQLGGPDSAHLGACADHDCGMAFLDPGGRRRWCAADRCGVRARVRAHRARAKTG